MRFHNRFLNPVVRALLRSPLHRLLSRSLLVLTYTGRRTGRSHSLPVMYARDADRLVVCAGHPERKRWWRNLRRSAPVDVRLCGRDYRAHARVLAQRDEIEHSLALYLARFPRAAKSLGIALDADGRSTQSALSRAAATAVVVMIETIPSAPT